MGETIGWIFVGAWSLFLFVYGGYLAYHLYLAAAERLTTARARRLRRP